MVALTDEPWRRQLRDALDTLPPERRRRMRCFTHAAAGTACLREAPGGSPLLDLASNDYLGLSRHPAVTAAAIAAIGAEGLGAGASRLISGTRPIHQDLEQELAAWLGREQVLLFPSGFQANIAAVGALVDRHSLVLADRLIHHSLLSGVRASGAALRRYAHNDLADLEKKLEGARRQAGDRRLLVLSESLFSMEGTSPDLAAMAGLCRRHQALLLVDEAHAMGLLGPGGRGLSHGIDGVTMLCGTFGKAFGGGGAFLATDALLGEWLLQRSGPFRYTTALAPPLAAGALAALRLIRSTPEAPCRLMRRANLWRESLAAAGWPRPPGEGPILSLHVGGDAAALEHQQRLERGGLLSVAIRPPTVPEGTARLRLVVRRDLPEDTLPRLLRALGPAPVPAGDGITAAPTPRAGEVIAMHGWAGQSTDWEPWRQLFESLGWRWQSAERGYGALPPAMPRWGRGLWRLLIAHSLGPHLLPPSVLGEADGVVLLASFGRFIPPGAEGRRHRAAIEGMLTQLSDPPPPSPRSDGMAEQLEASHAHRAWTMMQRFMEEVVAPDPLTLLPPGGVADSPPGPLSRQRLRRDLQLLRDTCALPDGFPRRARVLIVEAEQDRVLAPGARAALRDALPEAEIRVMAGAGHALLQAPVQEEVLKWLARAMPRDP